MLAVTAIFEIVESGQAWWLATHAIGPHELSLVPHELSLVPHELSLVPHELSLVPHELSLVPHELSLIPHELSLVFLRGWADVLRIIIMRMRRSRGLTQFTRFETYDVIVNEYSWDYF